LKVGWIDFLNTLPFDFSTKKVNFKIDVVKGVPSEINQLLKKGIIDVGFISSAEYIENFENYLILPDLSISSYKNVQSVGIFSNKPIEEIDKIYLSTASKTSRLLTKIVFKEFLKKDVKYESLKNYKDIEKKSILLIGDNAIKFKTKFKYVYDLSTIWFEKTGLPFVFALWGVNKKYFEKNSEEVIYFQRLLLETKEEFFKKIENRIKDKKLEIDKNYAVKYLKNLDYSLEKEHLQSLNYFSDLLYKHKLINKLPEFNFIGVKDEVKNK
jgi:chorismate dehydratase